MFSWPCCDREGEDVEIEPEVAFSMSSKVKEPRDEKKQAVKTPESEERDTGKFVEGMWFRQHDALYVCRIKRGILFYNPILQIAAHTVTELKQDTIQIEYEGKVITAELRDGKLTWSDGDVWIRHDIGLDGEWYCNGEHLASVKGALVYWTSSLLGSSQPPSKILKKGDGHYQMAVGSMTLDGTLSGSTLAWSDGQAWEKQQNNIDGDWYNESGLDYVAAVRGGMLVFAKKSAKRCEIEVNDGTTVILKNAGVLCKGQLQANRLVWQDGDVWVGDC